MRWATTQYGVDVGTTGARWAACDADGNVRALTGPARGPVVASLPADDSIFRIVELPPLRRREVPAAIRWELQRILPFPVEDGIFDYAELPNAPPPEAEPAQAEDGQPPRRRYAVSGGLEEAVNRRLAALRQLGIRPAVLEPEWVTLWRLARELSGSEETLCGVVDLGAAGTRLLVLDGNGGPVVFHRSPVGGRALDRELASMLGTTPEEAERLKFTELATDLGPLASGRALGELAGDLARALRRAQQEVRSASLEIWAVGGGALWPALHGALSEALGLELRLPGSSEAAGRSPVAALDPRWALAGTLARWHRARSGGRRDGFLARWSRRRPATTTATGPHAAPAGLEVTSTTGHEVTTAAGHEISSTAGHEVTTAAGHEVSTAGKGTPNP